MTDKKSAGKTLKFLVTGTGRCGTQFVSQYLQKKGLDVRHESMGQDGVAAWELTIRRPLYVKAPDGLPMFDRVLHLVRHPLKVIASLQSFKPRSWKYICRNSPCMQKDPLLLRCMKHYHYWNLMGESLANRTMRVEDFSMKTVGDFFEFDGPEPEIPRNVHSRSESFEPVSWAKLRETDEGLTDLIRRQCARYGYPT